MTVSNEDLMASLEDLHAKFDAQSLGQSMPEIVEKDEIGVPYDFKGIAEDMLSLPWMDGHGTEVAKTIEALPDRLLAPNDPQISEGEMALFLQAEDKLAGDFSKSMTEPYPIPDYYPPFNMNLHYAHRFVVQYMHVAVRPNVNPAQTSFNNLDDECWNWVRDILKQALKVDNGREPHPYWQ